MHQWGCSSRSEATTHQRDLILVLASNQFLILSRIKSKTAKWGDTTHKRFDFSSIKGDFVNMIELKQYRRENTHKNICSSIFVSIHLGY